MCSTLCSRVSVGYVPSVAEQIKGSHEIVDHACRRNIEQSIFPRFPKSIRFISSTLIHVSSLLMSPIRTNFSFVVMLVIFVVLLCVRSLSLRYSFEEELQVRSRIGNVKEDLEKVEPKIFETWDISSIFFAETNSLTGSLEFGSDGDILIKDRVDREAICTDFCSFYTHVQMYRYMNWSVKSFFIEFTVLDVNDNPPQFQATSIKIDLPLGVETGFEILLPNATDRDTWENSVTRYSISQKNSVFSIDSESPKLKILAKLVAGQIFRFSVISRDLKIPSFYDEMLLVIRVTEETEDLGRSLHVVIINEDTVPGTILMSAEDVSDQTAHFSTHEADKRLRVDPNNGKVELAGKIRLIQDQSIRLLVHVDRKTKRSFSRRTLMVEVRKQYRTGPSIDLMGSADVVNVPENQINVKIMTFRVFYKYFKKKHVDCFSPSSLVVVRREFSDIFRVTTTTSFDREKTEFAEIQIICFDDGFPSRKVSRNLMIMVEDVNDNLPFFVNPQKSRLEIFENQKVGTLVGKIEVEDADVHKEWVCKVGDKSFLIDSKTCELYSKVVFDYEETKQVMVAVELLDLSIPRFSRTREFTVVIKDLNDNRPSFVFKSCSIYVPLKSRGNFAVGSILAVDKDAGDNGKVEYSLSGTNRKTDETDISVNRYNGDVCLRNHNNEKGRVIYFTAHVADGGVPPLRNSMFCAMYLLELKDDFFFDYGILSKYVEISKNETFLLRNMNKKQPHVDLIYEMTGGGGWLDIDDKSGDIFLAKEVENHSFHQKVTVKARSEQSYAYNTSMDLIFYKHGDEDPRGVNYGGKTSFSLMGGVAGFLILLVVIIFYLRHRRKTQKNTEGQPSPIKVGDHSTREGAAGAPQRRLISKDANKLRFGESVII